MFDSQRIKKYLFPLSIILMIILIWDFLVRYEIVKSFLLPRPWDCLKVFIDMPDEISKASLSTLQNSFIGFILSCFLGYALAILFSLSEYLTQAFMPIAIFFQTMPIIAIAPLLVIWFGFGDPTVRVSSFIVSFFPVLSNSLAGLNKTSLEQIELFNSLQASKKEILLKLKIPDSLQFYFSGMKVAAGLSVIGAIVGEFIAGGGLGGLIDIARTQQRVDIVIACLLCSGINGLLLMQVTHLIEKILLRRRPYFASGLK